MEDSKTKSLGRDGVEMDESNDSHHREERSREKERKGEKHRERDRDRDRRHKREDSGDETNKDKEKHKSRRREKEREREKTKSHDDGVRDVGKSKEKSRDHRDADRDREDRKKDKERSRDKDREREKRDKEKEREKERERERERRDREKERETERERKDKERSRKHRDRSYSSDEDVRGHERKRHRRDGDYQSSEKKSKSNRHRDEGEESSLRRKGDGESANGEDTSPRRKVDEEPSPSAEKTQEEAIAEEQKKLDEEMEKRRRRVQEWQEQRRNEQSEKEKLGEALNSEHNSGKTWTLEGESDDEDAGPDGKVSIGADDDGALMPNGEHENGMDIDHDKELVPPVQGDAAADDDIDPLDAFMNTMVLPEVEKLNKSVPNASSESRMDVDGNAKQTLENVRNGTRKGRIMPSENSDSDIDDAENEGDPTEEEDDEEFMKRVKNSKVEKLSIVDHSKINYPPFRKSFYTEVKEILRMTPEEVAEYRKQLELKIHGKDVPKPVKTWHQTGLSTKILDTIRKLNYEKPMAIQAQALPVIMSGRDCIGIAKTGSGKTLAFVLPMLRHIKDQPPLASGDGPIGLILAPTRELVQQIYRDIKKISKGMGLSCVPVYGGSGVAQQIGELKRGAEIVVCTPGRMIDILCTSSGKITNLRRVTYLVMDEADRMFDMGFEPQITRIVQNTRPDRQTVLFSATFPRQVEVLARKVLTKPVELQVGGRSVVNKDITQLVELRPENERFNRLLEILGEWYEKGKTLIFVHTQDKCDALFKDLLRHGYPCLSLHGAKDQTDRESTIADFKADVCNILVATSIAARGLDVKELELVVNYDAPNHYEDYVHRVGRTGRAGRKGFAITFITEEDERYAPDLVKALELSEQTVPQDLKSLAEKFMAKVNQGLEQAHGTGFGGRGFKFNEEEDEVRKAAKKAQAKEYGFEEEKSDSEDEDETVKKVGPDLTHNAALAQVASLAAATSKANAPPSSVPTPQSLPNGGGFPVTSLGGATVTLPNMAAAVAGGGGERALAASVALQRLLAKIHADAMPGRYTAELEINDFPQNTLWTVTHKRTLGPISESTGVAITTRGQYFPPGKTVGANDRKLYLFIEGANEQSVKEAKAELKHVLEDTTNQATSLPGSAQPGRQLIEAVEAAGMKKYVPQMNRQCSFKNLGSGLCSGSGSTISIPT